MNPWSRPILFVILLAAAAAITVTVGRAQTPTFDKDVYSTSSCMGCHGQQAMGGLGPPIAKTKMQAEIFEKLVREGKGMMPATPKEQMSDEELKAVYEELQAKEWKPDQIPLAFKIGQFLSTRNMGLFFMGVTAVSLLFTLKVLAYWLRCAGLPELWPHLKKLGLARTAWITLRSLFVDGFLVISLWRRNRFRWAMHGLILYGFFGLMLADVLMQVFNPARGDLPFFSPLKMLPVISGAAVLTGMLYVMYRYKRDAYIDNGLTAGRDFLFVSLLLHTIISGFLTMAINRTTAHGWVMPIYIYHLASVSLLIVSAPFTRFSHAFLVPALVAMTRLTEAVTVRGVDLGFLREPSPGRHHKSERIARGVLSALGSEYEGELRLRYYP